MPDSQNPEHVRKLIREFQLKGANLIPTLTGEIVPTVLVADLTAAGPQAQDRIAFGGQIGTAAGVGDVNRLSLSNPAGSGSLILVDRIWSWNNTNADEIEVTIASAALTGAAGAFRDLRLTGEPVALLTRTAVTSGVLSPFKFTLLADTVLEIDMHIILTPNTRVDVIQLNDNNPLQADFLWRERSLLPGE